MSKAYIPLAVAIKAITVLFIGKIEHMANKGTDKQYVADSFIHRTTYHYQTLYQISRP